MNNFNQMMNNNNQMIMNNKNQMINNNSMINNNNQMMNNLMMNNKNQMINNPMMNNCNQMINNNISMMNDKNQMMNPMMINNSQMTSPMMNNSNQMNNNNNQMMNNPMMMNNNNQMNINSASSIQNQNMDNEALRIKKIIQPYEDKIKQLEGQIRQKDFEITCLKDKLDKNLQNNQNEQMVNMFSLIEQYSQMNQMMNQINSNMNQFNQMNNNMNLMNQFNQMNHNMNQQINEEKFLCLNFKKEEEYSVKVQCRSHDKIKDVLKKFCSKAAEDLNKFYFFYKGEKIINDELTLDEYGINDQNEIIVVEKNDTKQINEILKKKNSSNSKEMIPRTDKMISDDILSSENKKINLVFQTRGRKSFLTFYESIPVEQALKKYCHCLGLSETKMNHLRFLFNGNSLNINDKRSLGSIFGDGSIITVVDSSGVIGA